MPVAMSATHLVLLTMRKAGPACRIEIRSGELDEPDGPRATVVVGELRDDRPGGPGARTLPGPLRGAVEQDAPPTG